MPDGEYDPDAVEPKWQSHWVDAETYAYPEESTDPNTTFAIDTPPPTVSGNLHWGHVYGTILQDIVARFERMRGNDVFYPFGYDDNGIASERLTESELDIRHQEFERYEFQQKCREVCAEYEAGFTEKMQAMGISIDWNNTYQTISPEVQRVSQLSFIDLYEQGREYRKKAPAIWCPECETAISQVETEDMEEDSHFNDIAFELVEAGSEPTADAVSDAEYEYETATEPGDDIVISTTRPELIPACVSMFVHPDDERNAHLVGGTAKVPVFGHEVPIYEDDRVDMEKGTGVVMCCTFGDQTDIEWYQAHNLDLRVAIDQSGTMTDLAGEYEGMTTHEAREAIVQDIDDAGQLRDRRDITHIVQVHERDDVPVEYRVTEQWYVDVLDKREEYLEAGREMEWFPEKMFTRYKNWIDGLEWDWCISRQRSSGIPFPVWYCDDCGTEIIADKADLPVDPLSDEPPVESCPECGCSEFVPEDDVFDTWATSSLTPLINAGWDWDDETEEFTMERPEIYPMDLRPQGHDIISFWLFHTVIKCYEHTGEVPFDATMINGMVLDENRQKMSKSKGNVVDPDAVLEEYPVDAARFWAAGSAIGDDLPYQEKGLRAGEKLIRKLWNASKLVESLAPDVIDKPDELTAIDRWLLAELDATITETTDYLDNREFSKARDNLRTFFWGTFCDDYLEIAKQRLDDGEDRSAAYTLRTAHERFLKLFAPQLAHVTEELYREMYDSETSIHHSGWPEPLGLEADREGGNAAMSVVGTLRKYKSDRQLPLNAELGAVDVYGPIDGFESDIRGVMHVDDLTVLESEPEIESVITEIKLDYAKVGPEYGAQVPDLESGIGSGDYELVDDELHVAGQELGPDFFEVKRERQYVGDGEMLEAGETIVIVDES